MLLSPCPFWQPGGNGVRGALLGHAVVADHSVEAAPGVGILSRIVSFQRGRDTPLVLQGREGRTRMTNSRKLHASKHGFKPLTYATKNELGHLQARVKSMFY